MKRIAVVAAVVAAGAAVLIWCARPASEPVYQGKTVSQWLEPAGTSPGRLVLPGLPQPAAPPAIKQMGSNAVPSLIRMLRCRDSNFRTKFAGWVSKTGWLKSKLKLRPPAEEMQRRGMAGVAALGPVAQAAIPDVIDLLTDQNSHWRWQAFTTLEMIGLEAKTAVPAFLETLKDPDPALRDAAATALNRLTRDPNAIPALVNYLDDPDLSVRETVLPALQRFSRKPKLAAEIANSVTNQDPAVRGEALAPPNYLTNDPVILIPELSGRLRDGDAFVRSMTAFHLGEMGAKATSAIPALRDLLTDPAASVRQAATNALWEIAGVAADPEAANEKADITLNFPGVPVFQAVEIYEGWAGHRLVLSPNLPQASTIHVRTLHAVNRVEAMKMIENAVSEQTTLIIKNGHLSVGVVAKQGRKSK